MKVRTETNRYEWSHGRKPRGQGFWMMKVVVDFMNSRSVEMEMTRWGTMSDVRKHFVEIVKETYPDVKVCQVTVTVMP